MALDQGMTTLSKNSCVSILFVPPLRAAFNPTRTHSGPPLELQDIIDRGHFAEPSHSRLQAWVQARGGHIKDLGICVGTVIEGPEVRMEELGPEEKDDL